MSAREQIQAALASSESISLDDRMREFEAELIRWALEVSGGNKSRAAQLLKVKRSTLGDRIVRCGLERPAVPSPAPTDTLETQP